MHIREVQAAKKLKEVQAFLRQYIHDDSVEFVLTPEQADQLGIESTVLACYDRNGVVGVAHFTTPFGDANAALEKGAPNELIVLFLRQVRMLCNIAVREDIRDHGVGGELLAAAEAMALAKGATRMVGIAKGDLVKLERFYSMEGFDVLPVGAPLHIRIGGSALTFPIDVIPGNEIRWFEKSLR